MNKPIPDDEQEQLSAESLEESDKKLAPAPLEPQL